MKRADKRAGFSVVGSGATQRKGTLTCFNSTTTIMKTHLPENYTWNEMPRSNRSGEHILKIISESNNQGSIGKRNEMAHLS